MLWDRIVLPVLINQRVRATEVEVEIGIKLRAIPIVIATIRAIIVTTITIIEEKITIEKGKPIMRSLSCLFILGVIVISCNTNVIRSEYKSISGAVWNKNDVAEFTFSKMDSLQEYDVFINVRNDQNFPYSNLFLIASLNTPEGEIVQDTLEFTMAMPDGTWLGKGSGSLKENKLWYKENIVFPTSGVYTLQLSHAMRKNGNISGVVGLEGITDVGIEITKSNP